MIKVTSKNGNPVPDKPNMLHKAWNLTKSIVEYAKSGFENTAKDKYEERLIICDTCELLNKKKGTSQKITELLRERMYKSAFDSGYAINPTAIVNALKAFLVERTGIPFVSLNDMSYPTLNLKYNTKVSVGA